MTNEELILKFYDGDETILEKLYNKNIGFIRSIAKKVAVSFNCYNKSAEYMMKPDRIIKARKAAIRKMRKKYPESSLRLWKSVCHMVMRAAKRYHE